jgi:hypothetical protein
LHSPCSINLLIALSIWASSLTDYHFDLTSH